MLVLSAEAVDAALTFPDLIEALSQAFAGDIVAPVRHHHAMARPDGEATLLLMPAWTGGEQAFCGVKIVSVYPGNAARNLPSVLGTYMLMDGATGAPLAAIDGTRLTAWRTAAASALAARHLARPDAKRMVMVGAGALAPFLIDAHRAVRPGIEEVAIWNHRPERARELATRLQGRGFAVRATQELEGAVREADLVSCATLSTTPVVQGSWLKPGAHLDLVGAFNLRMREADDVALKRARVFIDTPAALREGGDVALGIKSGAIAENAVVADLTALCRGTARGRSDDGEITLFKSVGASLEDLAAAMLVWSRRGQ
jgi:ornithine cyclodeaminase/alanine dehydrogenase-like protein (mu-crystallin family)